MKYIHLWCLLTTFSTVIPAAAADRSVRFADEAYHCRFVSVNDALRVAEYTRDGETVDAWVKLIGVWHYPQVTGTPADGAASVIRALQAKHPSARFQFFVKEDKTEAVVDFITWPDDGQYAEFNIFRYLRKPGQPGLVAYQFAFRFDGRAENAAEQLRESRSRWLEIVQQMQIDLDFTPVAIPTTPVSVSRN